MLGDLFSHICSLNSKEVSFDIIEDGLTFLENAQKKANEIYNIFPVPVLADDSGLCVEALNYNPGIYSARYAGENATDLDNNNKLLKELNGIKNRRAYFECWMVLIISGKQVVKSSGRVYGRIIDTPIGKNGFGYDPIFFLDEFGKTMAELTLSEKNRISHRSLALKGIRAQIMKF